MNNTSQAHEIAELSAALTTAVMLICNRLIERGALDREEIKADLAAEVESIRETDPSVLKEMFLSGLAFALHSEPASTADREPFPSPTGPSAQTRDVEIVTIDDADLSLKLIGRDD